MRQTDWGDMHRACGSGFRGQAGGERGRAREGERGERETTGYDPFDRRTAQVPRGTEHVRGSYRGTSLIGNSPPIGPYIRSMPRALRWS